MPRPGRRALIPVLSFLVLAVVPLFLSSYSVFVLTSVLIFAIFAMSLDLLIGYLGYTSFGHAAFFGVGSYAAVLGTLKLGQAFWWSALLALAVVTLVAMVFGAVALRTSGLPFIMISLALAQALWGLAYRWSAFTGGDNGLSVQLRPALPVLGRLDSTGSFYYFVLIVFALTMGALRVLVRSPFGLSWRGIRDRELRMQVLGYHTWLHKYLAYLVAAFFGGVAGVLNASLTGFVSPEALALGNSATAILTVILGGPGTLVGPAVGAGVVVVMRQIVSSATQRWTMVLGAVYIVTVMCIPGGLMGMIRRLMASIGTAAASPAHPEKAVPGRERSL
ncbi:MAG TPA: branched-chain amino acid ABC transporter permease [Candidatus Sulfotelmatobacter sp.]|nr:branched-chain amino acid ABC transporter permease [Candidatus Sulfotelmatobacter sp.]